MSSGGKTAVIYGGPGPEHDVSVLTGLQVERCLNNGGTEATGIYWSKDGNFFDMGTGKEATDFKDGVPLGSERVHVEFGARAGFCRRGKLGRSSVLDISVAVVCCHGSPGECGRLQGLLDLIGIPYTGPTQPLAALGMDKLVFSALAKSLGIRCIPRCHIESEIATEYGSPLVLKPRFGGSSIGVEVMEDLASARRLAISNSVYSLGAIIEPYLEGWYDVNIGVRTWPDLQLSVIEKPLKGDGLLLSYADKYVPELGMVGAPREIPASISSELALAIRTAAERLAPAAGLRGVSRIDFMTDGERLLLNEINTIPGSMARYLWVEPKIAFYEQMVSLIEEAKRRPSYHQVLSGADGRLLRSAASVAAKLS